VRFDGHRYRDCRWCGGRGCLACEAEAEKAYRAAFPNGPEPTATFQLDGPGGGMKAFMEAFVASIKAVEKKE